MSELASEQPTNGPRKSQHIVCVRGVREDDERPVDVYLVDTSLVFVVREEDGSVALYDMEISTLVEHVVADRERS